MVEVQSIDSAQGQSGVKCKIAGQREYVLLTDLGDARIGKSELPEQRIPDQMRSVITFFSD